MGPTRRAWAGEDGRMTLNIAVIPGDGIGKEIVPEGLKVLDRVLADRGVDYSTTHFDLQVAKTLLALNTSFSFRKHDDRCLKQCLPDENNKPAED